LGGYTSQIWGFLAIKIDPLKYSGQVIIQAKPKILNCISTEEIYPLPPELSTRIIGSLIMSPLITGGKTIGLIMVECREAEVFDDSDLETLETLAFQVASAIEHARLLKKTKEIAIVEERTRLARDMHDGVAQNLAYLLIQVDRCLNMIGENGKLEKQLEQISSLLKQNIEELRRNIFDLRPVDLKEKSIFGVVENFVSEFGYRWNLETKCEVSGSVTELAPEVESSLYRILQEALSNARKHANCTQLSVSLSTKNSQWITLEVEDDGQGFELVQDDEENPNSADKTGLGLISMRERVERGGGQLTVASVKGQGTRIFAQLPVLQGLPLADES
jgi:signal transduction histidine kinase